MSFNVAMLKQMRAEGLSLDACIRVLEAGETEPSSAAVRQKRYRDNKRNERDVTRNVTLPLKEEKKSKPPCSEPIGSGGAAADPVKELFDVGVSVLTAAGQSEKQARSLIGKWRKNRSDGDVLAGLIDCRTKAISNPVEWLTKRFVGSDYVSASGYVYRGSIEDVIREATRRGDTQTMWLAKSQQRTAAHA